jgi:hypothetical protein
MPRNIAIRISGTEYVSILGRYFFKERYGMRSKDSLLLDADIHVVKVKSIMVYTVKDYAYYRRRHAVVSRHIARTNRLGGSRRKPGGSKYKMKVSKRRLTRKRKASTIRVG